MAKLIDITGKVISGEWGKDDENGNGIPVLRTTNFTNDGVINFNNVVTRIITKRTNIDDKFLRKGDIIIEKSGGSDKQPVGRVVYFDAEENKYLFNNFTGLLRVKDSSVCYPRFLFYVLFYTYRKGGTIPFQNKTTGLLNLKTDDYIKKLDIDLIPVKKQIKIVSTLDKLQSIIAYRKQQLAKLDELVKGRFVEMFGDPILNPKGWDMVELGDLTNVGSSKRIFEKEYVTEGIPFYRTKEIVELSKGNNISTELFITEERYSEIKELYGVPKKGDLLVSAVGTIGVIWIVDGKKNFYFKDGNLIKVVGSEKFNSLYMKNLLENLIVEHKKQMSVGTAYAALTISDLSKMKVYNVPIGLQNQFATFVTQVDKSKVAVQKAFNKADFLQFYTEIFWIN